jgi:two-component system, NarL family, nitrate/nitrite response regulator NarL
VLVIARDHLARAGLSALLEEQSGCTVAGQVDALDSIDSQGGLYRTDAIVWDMSGSADEAQEHIADLDALGSPVVALASDESGATDAWAAGARGVLSRDIDAETLVSTLDAVARGLVVADPGLSARVPAIREQSAPQADVTPRELQVLGLMAEGMPNKTIAVRLGISEHTVKFHVNALLNKLGAHSRTEAVTRATRMGLIAL